MKGIGIVGLGITGMAAARYFLEKGQSIAVHEKNDTPAIEEKIKQLQEYGSVEEVVGEKYLNGLASYDTVVLSPGVSPLLPEVVALKNSDTVVQNDITLFLEEHNGPTIGVTGSNGKSTIIALMHELFLANGYRSRLGGNIGNSPLEWIPRDEGDASPDLLEVSSAILELFTDKHYFDIVVFANISSNHLDRYPRGLKEYAEVKRAGVKAGHTTSIINIDDKNSCMFLLPFLNKKDIVAVSLSEDDIQEYTRAVCLNEKKEVIYKNGDEQTTLLTNIENMPLLGEHNTYNILTALASLVSYTYSVKENDTAVQNFKGLPHRLEHVATICGVSYVNDSKSTSPDATKIAISAIAKEKNIVLIAGGKDKDMSFEELQDPLKAHVHSLVVLPGNASGKIKAIAIELGIPHQDASDMKEAVMHAEKMGKDGDVILFSPAAGSGAQFINFEKRGDLFVSEVKKLDT